jgi:hypothetical protein
VTRTSLNDAASSATTDFPLSILPRGVRSRAAPLASGPRGGRGRGSGMGDCGSKVGEGGEGGGALAGWDGGSGAEGTEPVRRQVGEQGRQTIVHGRPPERERSSIFRPFCSFFPIFFFLPGHGFYYLTGGGAGAGAGATFHLIKSDLSNPTLKCPYKL